MNSRLLIFCPRYHTNMAGWIEGLLSHGYSIKIVVLKKRMPEDYEYISPTLLRISRVSRFLSFLEKPAFVRSLLFARGLTSFANFRSVISTLRLILTFKPDLFLIRSPTLPYHLFILFVALLLRKPIILYTQSPLKPCASSTLRYARKILSDILYVYHFSCITSVCSSSYTHYCAYSRFVPFSIPTRFLRSSRDIHKASERIGHVLLVTKMADFKNNHMVVDLIQRLNPNLRITIILGFINTADLAKKSELFSLQLSSFPNVSLLQDVQPLDMPTIYSRCGFYVLLSSNEPANYSLVESMSQGLVVFSPSSNGSSCYIEDQITGFIYNDNDLDSIATKINQLSSSIEQYRYFANNALSFAQRNFANTNLVNYISELPFYSNS
jgi:glycosyltransferase involved in cell wall biosynthesis